jgi:flagellar assembly factor FliW
MHCIDIAEPHPGELSTDCRIRIPLGLLGFEQFKRFSLVTNQDEEPFLWLQMLDEPHLAFLAISPFVILPKYEPQIPEADAQYLELVRPADALIFNLVTVRGPGKATINLKGPIVLNRHTLVAKQVIPRNASEFSVEHPLAIEPH